ncbi:hypothetical protein PN36_21690 [Candidatus Thiomargarita nelsonii]|uniref:Uncharacterized protein n=1 Tax=Candidatus Thiomargarita nelsonii TaxID=1003181 RepID=A0A4E0QNG0_9GAMM|nr:hypothetical protein PN36_21690 [Candidatus Thiomargarita nelsonii]
MSKIDDSGQIHRGSSRSGGSSSTLLTNILLFPFRLIYLLISGIFRILKRIVSFVLFLIVAILKTAVGLPVAIFLFLFVIVVMLPIKIVVYLLTFSYVILWEYSLFDIPKSVMGWIKDAWDYDDWQYKYF